MANMLALAVADKWHGWGLLCLQEHGIAVLREWRAPAQRHPCGGQRGVLWHGGELGLAWPRISACLVACAQSRQMDHAARQRAERDGALAEWNRQVQEGERRMDREEDLLLRGCAARHSVRGICQRSVRSNCQVTLISTSSPGAS